MFKNTRAPYLAFLLALSSKTISSWRPIVLTFPVRLRNGVGVAASTICSLLYLQEPSNKRVRPLARVTSLANLISPVRNGAVRRFGQTIQSFALRSDSKSPGCAQKSCSRSAAPTPPKRRNSVLWSEMLDVNMKESLSTKEIKRQEAIYEMSRGEQDLIEDLKLARKAYHDPMLKLSIMSEEELTHIFGDLDSYIPLHEDLLASLGEATKPDGTVEQIGPILVKWLPRLHAYKGYCSNQLAAKALLDQKKQDRRVQDFLQRCLESPFSRKLDLWSFLDIPRSRLVKYPLLLKEILRHTPKDHPDIQILEEAISIIQGVLSDINLKKGESECQYYIDKLEYLDEKQKDPRIEGSKALLCHGELKNKNGHRIFVRIQMWFSLSETLRLPLPRHPGFDPAGHSQRASGLPSVQAAHPRPGAAPRRPAGRRRENGRLLPRSFWQFRQR
ncbi:hypothetical protein llap_20864 [Limosa lapponica baueri]|uniref:DH domain-containing protein n=1 Tax=Limosa lapponica baueri TaxID=1758121 RepID=A0A2I0T4V9_LIMLA|nr:hypothetical protein llap_20864 [Limosa lapponica baueri]